MKKQAKPATGPQCSSTNSGYTCALTGPHTVHSNKEKRSGHYLTWSLIEDGRTEVTAHQGKSENTWYDDAPPAPVLVASADCDIEVDEGDDPLEDEVRSDADRDLARKMREDREQHARELEQSEPVTAEPATPGFTQDPDPKPGDTRTNERGQNERWCWGLVGGWGWRSYPASKGKGCTGCGRHKADCLCKDLKKAKPEVSIGTFPIAPVTPNDDRLPREPLERIGEHEVHPIATKFRMIGEISETDFAAFREDIRVNGQRERIIRVMYEGRLVILDGRNRLRACIDLGIEPQFRSFGSEPGDGDDPITFVLSKNVYRRHEDPTSLAYLAAELVPMYEAQAKERQRLAGGDRKSVSANLRGPIETSKAAEAAAKAMNVSTRSVEAALQVKRDAAPEVLAVKDRMAVSAAAKLAKLPKAKQREIVEKLGKGTVKPGKVASLVNQEKKRAVVRKINEQRVAPAPLGPFGVIVIDPPWPYENSDQHEGSRGHIDYPPMSMEAICALRSVLDPRAQDDCILGLWITNAFMHELGRVLTAWGFTHRTVITWDKVRAGVGTLPRGQTEHLVIATRGEPVHTLSEITTLLTVPRREHSRKPDEMYALLAEHCSGPMIDMFSREERSGWATWGAETSKFATEAA